MVALAYHVVFTTYGFWLPNDPRGSWSDFVRNLEVLRFGAATKTESKKSVAHMPHDNELRKSAKKSLKYKPVILTGKQALAIAKGFDRARKEGKYRIHACSILPEHVHLVIGRHDRHIGRIVGHIKARATQRLLEKGLWNKSGSSVWARSYWNVFMDKVDEVKRAIDYVEKNPEKEGKKKQRWPFAEPFI